MGSDFDAAKMEELSKKIDIISNEVKMLTASLLGTYESPGGYARRVVDLELKVNALQTENKNDHVRIKELEDLVLSTKSRMLGIAIGLAAGGTGFGVGITAIINAIIS